MAVESQAFALAGTPLLIANEKTQVFVYCREGAAYLGGPSVTISTGLQVNPGDTISLSLGRGDFLYAVTDPVAQPFTSLRLLIQG